MADEAQVRLLMQGAAAWNAWRAEHPETAVDLSGGALRGLDLGGADLSGANLRDADLRAESITPSPRMTRKVGVETILYKSAISRLTSIRFGNANS